MRIQNPESRIRNVNNARGQWAFTLIELLVAMSVLIIIMLIVTRIFAQATSAWTTGARRAEVNMTGRAVADFIAQDIAQAIPSNMNLGAASPAFMIIGDAATTTPAIRQVSYDLSSGSIIRREGPLSQQLCDTNVLSVVVTYNQTNAEPTFADVAVTVADSPSNRVFTSRADFSNRKRYKY